MSDRIPTFADLCNAIVEGQVPAMDDGSMYHINAFELRRYLNKFRSLPTISPGASQDPTSHSESQDWSISVA
jgi:hypothetical protein